jgi:hypothetical protein
MNNCKNEKGRIKRIRNMNGKWKEMKIEVKEKIIEEFKIKEKVRK